MYRGVVSFIVSKTPNYDCSPRALSDFESIDYVECGKKPNELRRVEYDVHTHVTRWTQNN